MGRICEPVPTVWYLLEQVEKRVIAKTAGLGADGGNIRTDIDIRMFPPEHQSNEIVIVPTHIQFDHVAGKRFTLARSQIDIYYRCRNLLDPAHRSRQWIKQYYILKTAVFMAFNEYWMRCVSSDSLNGKFIVDEPIKPQYMNEPRKSMRDPNQGEGMVHLPINFYLDQPYTDPDV